MAEINCYLPIKLRISGKIDEALLERLEQQLVPLVSARLALAERTIAARTPGYSEAGSREVVREEFQAAGYDEGANRYRVPSYQRQGQPTTLPVVPAGERQRQEAATRQHEQATLRRIHSLLSTGLFDWWVSNAEAREVLHILQRLAPEELLYIVMVMRLIGSWNKFRRALPSSDSDALDALEMTIDPNTGYIMPGDVLVIQISGLETGRTDYQVDRDGLRLPYLQQPVPIVGLLPAAAARLIARAYVDALILVEPTVELGVRSRGIHYAGRNQGPFDRPITFTGAVRADPNSPEGRRRAKRREFLSYIAPVTAADALTAEALNQYLGWIDTNYNTPDFLTRTPVELWEWALHRAAAPGPTSPLQPFLDLLHSMQARLASAPPTEQASLRSAIGHYLSWLELHSDDPKLSRFDPVEVWVQAYMQAVRGETREAVARRRQEAAERAAAPPIDWAAVDKKFGEALQLMMTRVWALPEPQIAEARSTGVGYLIFPSEEERRARDAIARGFLDDVVQRMADPNFTSTSVTADFRDWLLQHPEQRIRLSLAESYPDVERYAVPIEIPDWQTAVEVGIGFIPIVGQVVGGFEVIAGQDLFGHPLSPTDRAIIAAGILLPAAAKVFRAGRAAVTVSRIASEYRLSAGEADALYRATVQVRPGTAGARLLSSARDDVLAGRPVRDPERLRQLDTLMRDMGVTDRSTLRAVAPAEAGAARSEAQAAAELRAEEPLVAEGAPAERGTGAPPSREGGGPGEPGATGGAPPPTGGLPGTTGTRHLPREFQMPARNRSSFASTSEQIGTAEQREAGNVRVRAERVGPGQQGTRAMEVPRGRTGLRDHWVQHGQEFPEYRNARQYEQGAIDFCRDSATKRFYYRYEGRPTIGYYNEATGTFAATSVDGETIYTYFRPAGGMRDFLTRLRLRGVRPGVTPRHAVPLRQGP